VAQFSTGILAHFSISIYSSLEQRILINSDCHAVFTQKEVFSDQILFQHPLLRSITTCFSVSIRTSGDI